MGSPLAETTIINVADGSLEDYDPQDGVVRTHSDEHNVYDDLALDYDGRYTSPECQEENAAVRRLINSHFTEYGPKTLDVGCGTGLLLDLKITSPAIYTGIDPSQAMLNELVRKHPKVADLVPGPFGKVWREAQEHGPYDLVVSLFGSASYLHPDQIEALPSFSSDMTVTMTYAEGYWPDYYGEQEPPTAAAAREAALRLTETWGAERLKIGNFDVMVVRL